MAFFSVTFQLILRADLHGTIFVACDNGLRQAHDMIYDCCVRQKECRSILKHVLKRCDNRKSCRRPVIACRMRQKSYRVNQPLRSFLPRRSQRKRQYHKLRIFSVERTKIGVQHVRQNMHVCVVRRATFEKSNKSLL